MKTIAGEFRPGTRRKGTQLPTNLTRRIMLRIRRKPNQDKTRLIARKINQNQTSKRSRRQTSRRNWKKRSYARRKKNAIRVASKVIMMSTFWLSNNFSRL